jgi:hypothetical protein
VSYRGEFTWEPDEDRAQRMRIVAAVALLCAGWAVGFFSGRMSAWLFPVTDTQVVVMQKAPEPATPTRAAEVPPAAPAAASAQTEPRPRAAPGTQSTASAQESPAPTAPAAKKDGDNAGTRLVESEAESNAVQPENTPQSKVTVINPDADKRAPTIAKGPARNRDDTEPVPREPSRLADDHRPAYGFQASGQAAIMECERRYNSFRRSDGTYQPYNSSSRERCPLLR